MSTTENQEHYERIREIKTELKSAEKEKAALCDKIKTLETELNCKFFDIARDCEYRYYIGCKHTYRKGSNCYVSNCPIIERQ